MPIEAGLQALSQFEQRTLAGDVKVRIKGLFRPRVVLQDLAGDVLCEIRAGPVFGLFPHRARCSVLGVEMTLGVAGFINRTSHLHIDGDTVLSVSNRVLVPRYVVRDWQGDTHELRRRGRPWRRRFKLVRSAGEEELIGFDCASFGRETALSIRARPELKPGITAGLTLLLYYDWYLSLRAAFISAGGAGG